jgi:hypothetical protein
VPVIIGIKRHPETSRLSVDLKLECHQADPRNDDMPAMEYQSGCENKLLLYPESVPIWILKKWDKPFPDSGIIAQLISLQLEIEELANTGIVKRKIYVDPDPHNLRSRVDLLH